MKYLKYTLFLILITTMFCASATIVKEEKVKNDVPVVSRQNGIDLEEICMNFTTGMDTLKLVNIKDGSINDCGLLTAPHSLIMKMKAGEMLVYIMSNMDKIRKCEK